MKPHFTLFATIFAGLLTILTRNQASAQQYKLKQTTSIMGMKSETTIYVKGMRKRTEPGAMLGMPAQPVTIEQCDLQRTIKINDKKKLYFIEPFAKEQDEVIDEDAKTAVKPKTVAANPKKGGIITNWYSITDTGERKKMFGFTARHVWTYQKMKPSPEACSMKDSFIIKTDGWYIDLPQFNCPVRYRPARTASPGQQQKPDCLDRFVTRRSGKGKLGFPLVETTTYVMGGGAAMASEFKSDIETLELTTAKLDSMLFEVPPGYTEAKSEEELQEKFDMKEMMNQYKNMSQGDDGMPAADLPKKAGQLRIGVYEPKTDGQLQTPMLQQHIVNTLNTGSVEAVAVSSAEEARAKQCDMVLNTDFVKMKQASKVGGLLKAVKNNDPSAVVSFTIEANMALTRLADGSVRSQQHVNGKFEGQADEAAKKSLEKGCELLLKDLQ
jgi:hypothetical protein